MKLNLGCGTRKLAGHVNVDSVAACGPDVVWDLERFPWPFEDDSAEEIVMIHVLEHLGASPAVFIGVMKELYRVARPGASVKIIVPHPRSDAFLGDPTHVRPVTVATLLMFSQDWNRATVAENCADTPLGLYHGIDFRVAASNHRLTRRWGERLNAGTISREDLIEAMETHNNVVEEIEVVLEAVKPAGSSANG